MPNFIESIRHVQEKGSGGMAGVEPSCNVLDEPQKLMVCQELFEFDAFSNESVCIPECQTQGKWRSSQSMYHQSRIDRIAVMLLVNSMSTAANVALTDTFGLALAAAYGGDSGFGDYRGHATGRRMTVAHSGEAI